MILGAANVRGMINVLYMGGFGPKIGGAGLG